MLFVLLVTGGVNNTRSLPGGKAPSLSKTRPRALWATDSTVVNSVCVDYSAAAHWSKSSALIDSLPDGNFVSRPATLSVCELERLHTECVGRINKYRSGELKFSDGTDDSNVLAGLPPLVEATGTNECSSQQALGDLLQNVNGGGGCAGGHHTAFNCPWAGSVAQNTCCGRGGGSFGSDSAIDTYEEVRDELFGCLQQMWDEGIAPGQKGHWETMRNPNLNVAHCGFAFTTSGRMMANQDFAYNVSRDYQRCSCEGKTARADDGCGGACVACADPEPPACADASSTGWSSSSCSGDGACTCADHEQIDWLKGCEDDGVRAACPVSCLACPDYQSTCPEGSQATGQGTDGAVVASAVMGTSVGLLFVGGAVAFVLLGRRRGWQLPRSRKRPVTLSQEGGGTGIQLP